MSCGVKSHVEPMRMVRPSSTVRSTLPVIIDAYRAERPLEVRGVDGCAEDGVEGEFWFPPKLNVKQPPFQVAARRWSGCRPESRRFSSPASSEIPKEVPIAREREVMLSEQVGTIETVIQTDVLEADSGIS